MSEAPESIGPGQIIGAWTRNGNKESGECAIDGPYTRTDLYEEAVRQRDELLQVVKDVRGVLQDGAGDDLDGVWWSFARQMDAAIAACSTPPLARGDVKTGKVITSAELIEATDTPEIRGAVAPEGGGRHT